VGGVGSDTKSSLTPPMTTPRRVMHEVDPSGITNLKIEIESHDDDTAVMALSTVTMTREAVRRAWEARKLHLALQHPPETGFEALLKRGAFPGINDVDWRNATEWFGHCRACTIGKIKERPAPRATQSPPPSTPGEEISIDLFFVNRMCFIMATCRLCAFWATVLVGGKQATTLSAGLDSVVAIFNRTGRKVRRIRSDGESGLAAASTQKAMAGRHIDLRREAGHAAEAERAIQTMRDGLRATLAGLPYHIPLSWIPSLVAHITACHNVLSNVETYGQSPFEVMTGRAPNYKRLATVSFGDKIVTRMPSGQYAILADKSLLRGEEAIFMGCDVESGAVQVLLRNGRRALRRTYKQDQITQSDIENINKMAERDKKIFKDEGHISITRGHQHNNIDRSMSDTLPVPLLQQLEATSQEDAITAEDLQDIKNTERHLQDWKPIAFFLATRRTACGIGETYLHEKAYRMTVKTAVRERPEQTTIALKEEATNLLAYNTFSPVDARTIRDYKRVMRLIVFLKEKPTTDNPTKLKARAAVDGSREDLEHLTRAGINKSSPTIRPDTVLTMIAIAAKLGLPIKVGDVKAAYLNAKLEYHDHFIKVDPTFASVLAEVDPSIKSGSHVLKDGSMMFRLNKALYGLAESAILWYKLAADKLQQLGYKASSRDRCLFMKKEAERLTDLVGLHVDDYLAVGKYPVLEKLGEQFGKLNIQDGLRLKYIGLSIESTNQHITVHQNDYLQKFTLNHTPTGRATKTPLPVNHTLLTRQPSDSSSTTGDTIRSAAMTLMYAAVKTRPDLLDAASTLATVANCTSDDKDIKLLHRVSDYIQENPRGIRFTINKNTDKKTFDIQVYADAAHQNQTKSRSTSGIMIFLDNALTIWRRAKQHIISRSSAESELVALNEATALLRWLTHLLAEMNLLADTPTTIHQDNTSTIQMAETGVGRDGHTGHMEGRLNYVKTEIDEQRVKLKHTPTEHMLADILTKTVNSETHWRTTNAITVCTRTL